MNIGGIGQGFYQNPQMQGNMLRQMIENSGSENLKKMAQEGASDEQLMKYALQNPAELQGNSGTPWADSALGTGTANQMGTNSTAQQTGNADAAGAAATGSDQIDMSSDSNDSSDCYDENDEIPTDEAMATSGMCGMDDVSGADRCKPHTQQCLGETKAIKKVLEQIQKADQDNSTIGADISQVDQIMKDLSSKLKKGKKAADSNFSNPQDPAACGKEVDDLVKKAVDLAANNGVEIEVSEKRGNELGGGGGQQQGAPQAAKGADKAGTANKPQAGQQQEATQQAKQQQETKQATEGNQKANDTDGPGEAGGGQDDQKPFKITTEPKEVDKDLGLDEVKNNPQLAQALESSLDDTLSQLDAQQQGQPNEGMPPMQQQGFDLGATRAGSPLAQGLDAIGGPQGGGSVFGGQQGGGSVFGGQQGGGFGAGMPGGMGGGMQGAAPMGGMGGGAGRVNTSGIEAKMKRAGIDTGKKFKVKAQVYEPGMDVKVTRDGAAAGAGPMKVGKNMDGATMKVKPPPLAAIDQNGELHKLGDIKATDGGKSGIFAAKIKEGQPVMNLQSAVNSVSGDVALPGTKTEEAKAT
ncbi:MAG: hypothetical protein AB2L14_30695 [Candidatus Xenobiia bacterium LiM19]